MFRHVVMTGLLAVGMSGLAAAEEEQSTPVVVPEARLEGTSEGEGQLKVSLAFQEALSEDWDRQIRLSYQIGTKDGLADLFSPDEDLGASAPWSLGVTYTFARVSTRYTEKEKVEDATLKACAWCKCAQRCGSALEEDKTFCALNATTNMPGTLCNACEQSLKKLPAKPHPFFVDAGDLCPSGQQFLEEKTPQARFARYTHPIINLGARAGRDEFKFLQSNDGTPVVLTPKTQVGATWRVGASGVWLKPLKDSWLSLEGLVGFSSGFEAQSTKARWCLSQGDVVEDGKSAAAETCKEAVLGAPERVESLDVAAYVGSIDQRLNTYRVAAGLQAHVPFGSASEDRYRLSFSLPVYINLTGADEAYKGIVRVGPSVTYANKRDGKSEMTLGVSLALLGQRLLFSRDFDKL